MMYFLKIQWVSKGNESGQYWLSKELNLRAPQKWEIALLARQYYCWERLSGKVRRAALSHPSYE